MSAAFHAVVRGPSRTAAGNLPDFTPGFMPVFRRQIGDPTTSLDGFICTLESAAMVLEWHTRGAISVWGGQLIPWCGKTEAQIAACPRMAPALMHPFVAISASLERQYRPTYHRERARPRGVWRC